MMERDKDLDNALAAYLISPSAQDGFIFRDEVEGFLFLDYSYASYSKSIISIFTRYGEGFGWICSFDGGNDSTYDRHVKLIPSRQTVEDLERNETFFEIESYCEHGCLVASSHEWLIWFSHYHEVAIAAFLDSRNVQKFRTANESILFWDAEILQDRLPAFNENLNRAISRIEARATLI